MKRVTPEMVHEAVEATGSRLVRGTFFSLSDPAEPRCCPLGALYLALQPNAIEEHDPLEKRSYLVLDFLTSEDYARDYLQGFIAGWDEGDYGVTPGLDSWSPLERQGYEDGRIVYMKLKGGE